MTAAAGDVRAEHDGVDEALRAQARETCSRLGVDLTWCGDHTLRRARGLSVLRGATLEQAGGVEAGAGPVSGALPLPPLSLGAAASADEASDLRVLEILGEGGMGIVRLAEQRSLGRVVAVKSLRPAVRGDQAVAALLHEARVSGLLEHPNIVPVHQLGWSAEDGPVLVMKRVEGASWAELARDDAHPLWADVEGDRLERHLEILLGVCRALAFAHARGVLHLDVKPANVLLGRFGEVYLVDWGVAVVVGEGGSATTEGLVGTPAFMAPELTEPGRVVDTRTDVYLLGATLHQILVGRSRHHGADLAELLARARASRPWVYPDSVPEELAALCNRACARDPDERFASALAFQRAVTQFLHHRVSVSACRTALERLDELERVVAAAPAPGEDEAARAQRIQALYAESRFGFAQARREWPENPAAQGGLQRCLERMIAYELEALNVRAAAALVAELPEARPALAERLERARAERSRRDAAEARLDAIERDQRVRGVDAWRSLASLWNGITGAAVLATAGWLVRTGRMRVTNEGNLAVALFATLCMLSAIALFRRKLLDTALYRRIIVTVAVLFPLLCANRLLGIHLELPFRTVFALDVMTLVTITLVTALLSHAFVWGTFVIVVGLGVPALVWPGWEIELSAVGWLANAVFIAWVVRPGGVLEREERAAPAGERRSSL